MRMAVINENHTFGFQIIAWMLKDLGFEVWLAGDSFRGIVPHYNRGVGALRSGVEPFSPELHRGLIEWGQMPQDALFVCTFPETERALRSHGWKGPILLFWMLPVGPDWVREQFRPGPRVSALALCPSIGRVISENRLCPVESLWPPYIGPVDQTLRTSFNPFLITVIQNAAGWTDVGLLEKLRDDSRTRLELYGGMSPAWSAVIPHASLTARMRSATALFHPKPTDTPGFALMEAILQGVPVIVTPGFMKNTEMSDVLVNGETAIIADPTFDNVMNAFVPLSDPEVNRKIGNGARSRLSTACDWKANRERVERLVNAI